LIDTKRRDEIRAYCAARRIEKLVHFTPLENLAGILVDGILPRLVLESRAQPVFFNDGTRADGRKNAACLSISFPNYKMFYKYRQADRSAVWAVVLIRADALWELDCAFSWVNAACSAIRNLRAAQLKSPSSLALMFAEQCKVSGVRRSLCRIPESFPTNPQAEVLVYRGVPPSYLTAACFQDESDRSNFSRTEGRSLRVGIEPDYFGARCDWEIWKQIDEASRGESWQDGPSSVPF
jgi:hypothetical protein